MTQINRKLQGGRGQQLDQVGTLDSLSQRARDVNTSENHIVAAGTSLGQAALYATVLSSTVVRFVPLPPIQSPMRVTRSRIVVDTAESSTTMSTALFVYSSQTATARQVPGSEAVFSLGTAGTVEKEVNCILLDNEQYLLGFIGTGVTTATVMGSRIDGYLPMTLRGVYGAASTAATRFIPEVTLRDSSASLSGTEYPLVVYFSRIGTELVK